MSKISDFPKHEVTDIEYTIDELKKHIALVSNHMIQLSYMPTEFCLHCIEKHCLIIEGLCEEAMTRTEDPFPYIAIARLIYKMRYRFEHEEEPLEIEVSDKEILDVIRISEEMRTLRKTMKKKTVKTT